MNDRPSLPANWAGSIIWKRLPERAASTPVVVRENSATATPDGHRKHLTVHQASPDRDEVFLFYRQFT